MFFLHDLNQIALLAAIELDAGVVVGLAAAALFVGLIWYGSRPSVIQRYGETPRAQGNDPRAADRGEDGDDSTDIMAQGDTSDSAGISPDVRRGPSRREAQR